MTCPRLSHECASKNANGQIERQIVESGNGNTRPKGGRSSQLKRLLKLWSSFERKTVNLAIIKEDNTTTTNADEAADALARGWSKVFAEKSINSDKAKQFIQEDVVPMILKEHQLPKQPHVENFLNKNQTQCARP